MKILWHCSTIVGTKEYIYISKRTDTTPLRLPNICPPNLSLQYTPTTLLTCNSCCLVLNGPSWTSYRTSLDVTSAGLSPGVVGWKD